MILQINADHPQPRYIDQVVEALDDEGLVAYPTDTVYGIGCSIERHEGITSLRRLVSEMKDAPEHAPLSFICERVSQISEYAHVDDEAFRLIRRLLPGPYTFILEATRDVPAVMRKQRDTVGIRIPSHPIPQAIVERLGHPVATTSAMTDDDQELIADPWTLEDLYEHLIDIVVDGGYVFPEPSTVIDLSGDFPVLVREGKGSIEGMEFVEVVEDDSR
jgi:tRNA threonylcarbamoyl adenosine modification protein (Sua5/YciO/YrdC/YwlC family)